MVMKFELLPNEINIFYSFDQLNNRFSDLIRILPLHLSCHDVRKSVFDYFCKKIFLIPELKINLSDDNLCTSIEDNYFVIEDIIYLQQLTINRFDGRFQFDDLIRLLKQISNLKSLIIYAKHNKDIVDGKI
jgi:hypothetical protein